MDETIGHRVHSNIIFCSGHGCLLYLLELFSLVGAKGIFTDLSFLDLPSFLDQPYLYYC